MTITTTTGIELYQSEAETMKECIEQAAASGVCLDNADFSNLDLEGIRLIGVSLQWCDFSNAKLSFGELTGCNLSNSILRGATFYNSNLKGSYMRNIDMHGCNFANANLQNSNFRRNATIAQDINEAIFINANLKNAHIEYCNFKNCDFSKAKFIRSVIKYSSFESSNLNYADFGNAKIDKSHIPLKNLVGVNLKGCNYISMDTGADIYLEGELKDCELIHTINRTVLMCPTMVAKTIELDRTRIAHYLYSWLDGAENLSEFEVSLKDKLKGYGSRERFIELKQVEDPNYPDFTEFKSYIEPNTQE